jgi:hypothetical protein
MYRDCSSLHHYLGIVAHRINPSNALGGCVRCNVNIITLNGCLISLLVTYNVNRVKYNQQDDSWI